MGETLEEVRIHESAIRQMYELLHAESGHGIEMGGAPRRHGACQNCDREQRRAGEKVHDWIGGGCPIEHRPDQPRNSGAGDESESESEDCGAEAVAEHDPHHLFASRSERDANADLGGALGDDV